jgi:UDP-N-acetylmuramoyl-L-alanyl-D-glutamate--2,6-diaminopimelate ligase
MSDKLNFFFSKYDDLTTSSNNLEKNSIFVAYPGETKDGRDYIPQAIQNGASAVLYDPIDYHWDKKYNTPHLALENLGRNLSKIASDFYRQPSKKINITGITGTNGKTSCAYWLTNCLNALKSKTGFIGTMGYGNLSKLTSLSNTTPGAIHSQQIINEFNYKAYKNIVMEISSHGISQGRVSAIDFNIKLFTNLTRDHLDYHKTIEKYEEVKSNFILDSRKNVIVVNVDDAVGKDIYSKRDAHLKNISYAIDNDATLRAVNIRYFKDSTKFDLLYNNESSSVNIPIIGKFNIYNILGVIGCLISMNYKVNKIIESLQFLGVVPGRLEFINKESSKPVVIDYAHTPDALESALLSLKKLNPNRVILVFGCGGNRDQGKRKDMAKVANNLADYVVVTSDNPRYEEPKKIIQDISRHLEVEYVNIEDRGEAIKYAINDAKSNDFILIAGKGHEEYQEIMGQKIEFSDKKFTQKYISELAGERD